MFDMMKKPPLSADTCHSIESQSPDERSQKSVYRLCVSLFPQNATQYPPSSAKVVL